MFVLHRFLGTILLIANMQGKADANVSPVTGAGPDSTVRFPKVEGSNLEGRRFSLPIDFGGEINVVLVAFRREQQDDVDTWMPFLKTTAAKHAAMRVYELPTLNRGYRMMRGFIDGGMARGIPEKATRETTITLYINKTPFKKALGISAENQIVVFLVARDGRVLWRADGRHTTGAAVGLAAEIERLAPARVP